MFQAEVTEAEQSLRGRLGIPEGAARVLVFCESSHWDTNWLQTSEEYFERRLQPIFTAVMRALETDPERIYNVESVFFLKLFWERNPDAQARLRKLIERRQLRLSSSSFTTTPDTLLPHPEAILRDFHLGQEWLRRKELGGTPRTAYFPDNFGHSPHLPSLMRAARRPIGPVVTRIDGMYFIASDYRRRRAFPLAGSSAELLEKTLKTLDFVWRDDDGAEVLCHWSAFTYFQGDMLAHLGATRWNGHCYAVPWRTRGHIARRIDGFVRQLAPLARTPYLFCPIGMDFNDPIHELRGLLTRYNREHAPSSGTWAVLAGLDDYLDLLNCHREKLPVIELDPNPYWMGFYASRPELKQRPMRVARSLVLAENLSALSAPDADIEASIHDAWAKLILINHHDAITGTSPDRVWEEEQRRWLDVAEADTSRALALISGKTPLAEEAHRAEAASPQSTLRCWREGGEVVVESDVYRLRFAEAKGGCLTSLVVEGDEQLRGLGFDLLAFADEGGLWRLGHEFAGGRFAEIDRASQRRSDIEIARNDSGLVLRIASELAGGRFTRTVSCRAEDPFLRLTVEGAVSRRVTVTCRCDVIPGATALEMDTVGGSIERPPIRFHTPTFWSVPSLVSLRGGAHAFHVGFEAPTAVSFNPPRSLEWIVARNASKERAFGFLPVLAHPIGGTSDEVQTHRSALLVTQGGAVPAEVRRRIHLAWYPEGQSSLRRFADTLVRCDDPAVAIVALKRADVGGGIIVRLGNRSPLGDGRCE